jgi:glycerol-3-phosphate acyltransferase PlsY
MRAVLAFTIAYLLGSVLPAEIFARARGVDIRAVGTRNPGTTNALEQLGVVPGLVTGVYDGCVGLISIYLASLLGLPPGWTYVAGLFAVLGHCFPLFSRFRGGQGMAATTGMLLYTIAVGLQSGWLTPAGIGFLGLIAVAVFALTRSATDVGVFVAPLLVVEVVLGQPEWQLGAFTVALAAHIWFTQLWIARTNHLFRLAEPVRARLARLHASSR